MIDLVEEGRSFLREGNLEEAHRCFATLLDQKTRTLEAHQWLARLAFAIGDLEEAGSHVQSAAAIDPADLQTKALEGLWLLVSGRPQEALPLLESVASSAPGLAFNLTNLAACYLVLDRPAESVKAARAAVQGDAKDPGAHFVLSQALAFEGQLEDSMNEALETLKWNPSHLQAYLFLGALYQQAGESDAARELYREALHHIPEAPQIQEALKSLA